MSPPMTRIALSAQDVRKAYGRRLAVAGAGFTLRTGRITCLLGPSGCGKSTLLRLIAGLETADGGRIDIDGRVVSSPEVHVAPERRGVGLVFQDFALFPHLDVAGNIGFGLKALTPAARRDKVRDLLTRFRLEGLAEAWPHTLSGGEQQRVAIARALARDPAILLLDEPFSGLDGPLRAAVRQSVLDQLRAADAAVLIVTHDPEEAMLAGDDLLLMADGRILQAGTPQDCYLRPASPAAARLLGEVVALHAQVRQGTAYTALGPVPAPDLPDGEAVAVARPEGLILGAHGMEAKVQSARFAGAFHRLTLSVGDLTVSARTAQPPPPVGTHMAVALDDRATCVYGVAATS